MNLEKNNINKITKNCILLILLVVCGFFCTNTAYADSETGYRYASLDFSETAIESLFFGDSAEYNHDMSIIAIESLLDGTCLKGFDRVVRDYESETLYKPSNETRYELLKKQNTNGYTLYALCLNGSNMIDHWLSNFDIGYSDAAELHKGFKETADNIWNELSSYISEMKNNKDKCKLLVSGHSRGSAVGAIIASRLMEEGVIDKENLFVYTYACPNYSLRNKRYNNIFFIDNPGDITPQLPPKNWGYHREGKTITLPQTLRVKVKLNEYLSQYQLAGNERTKGYEGFSINMKYFARQLGRLVDKDLIGTDGFSELASRVAKNILGEGELKYEDIRDVVLILLENRHLVRLGACGVFALFSLGRFEPSHGVPTYACYVRAVNEVYFQ